eukprot:362428-Chlamydomonas_euryale.AAC.2
MPHDAFRMLHGLPPFPPPPLRGMQMVAQWWAVGWRLDGAMVWVGWRDGAVGWQNGRQLDGAMLGSWVARWWAVGWRDAGRLDGAMVGGWMAEW